MVGGGQVQIRTFLYRKYERGIKESNHVNDIEHNVKQNNYTGTEVISLIPPLCYI